jgi:hypothetical protein
MEKSNTKSISDEIVTEHNDYIKKHPDILNSSKNKDIAILVGNTGVGKTTFMHYLAGTELIVTDEKLDIFGNKSGGKISLKSTSDQKAGKIGHSTKSETISPNFINLKDVVLYDLAGLGDNRGPAVLILNTFIIKNIIENARSVKIIFLTSPSELQGARGDKFKYLRQVSLNAFNLENFRDISCLVINKSTLVNVQDEVSNFLSSENSDSNLISPWYETDKIGKMCVPVNGKVRQEERQELLNLIASLKAKKIKFNSQKLFSNYEETIINTIISNELQEINNKILKNYDSNILRGYNLNDLNNKKTDLETKFDSIFDSNLSNNKLISIVSSLAIETFETSLDKIKNSDKKQIALSNLNNLINQIIYDQNLKNMQLNHERILREQQEEFRKAEKRRNFIRSIQVLYSFSTKSDVNVPNGYYKIGQDLNQGCGGWFLYIAYSKETHHGNPLLDITSFNNGRRGVNSNIGHGWECVRANDGSYANTNRSLGSKGDDISLFVSRSNNINHGITDIWVGSFDNSSNYCPEGYTRVQQDLSQGAGGKYIYLAYKKEQIN